MVEQFIKEDLVYCPLIDTHIHYLQSCESANYPLKLSSKKFSFTQQGFNLAFGKLPVIFKATEKNCELLSKLYGMEFDSPKKLLVDLLRQHFNLYRKHVVIKTNGSYFIVSGVTSDAVIGPHSLSQFLRYIEPYSDTIPFLVLGN